MSVHAGTATNGAVPEPWLVVIDMQAVFGDSESPWFAPRFAEASEGIRRLMPSFGERIVLTRFVAPAEPRGAWIPYYEQWPFALVPPEDPLYALVPEFAHSGHPVVTCETFGKWGDGLDTVTGGSTELVIAGVSTDCCVLSTVLPAADAGVHVRVPADACAGASDADHRRALGAMALYAPLIEVTSVDAVLTALAR